MAILSEINAPDVVSTFTVAVAGNPNCGKTTLFNALTGLRHKVGNYAGVTVERLEGELVGVPGIKLIDLPGAYSLSARSPDERVARDVLLGHVNEVPQPDAVLVVVDASNLERNLYLASQVIELGSPVIVICNMMDRVDAAGEKIDFAALSKSLGVPVVPATAWKKLGIEEIRDQLLSLRRGGGAVGGRRTWTLPDPIEQAVTSVASAIAISGYASEAASDTVAQLLLTEPYVANVDVPVIVGDEVLRTQERWATDASCDASLEMTSARYAWLAEVVDSCLTRSVVRRTSQSDRMDAILTHRVWGMFVFGAMMSALFFSIFSLADPLMGMIEVVVKWAQTWVVASMAPGVFRSLLTDGVIAGVGNIVIFFPQICILFLFLAMLEDTGYMARAAFLMDRVMRKVGLHGKSFIPLLSSHACAIPGIMATRTIEDSRDRLITILVAPLMSCSARLPVYAVLIAACLPGSAWIKAFTMLSMYLLGIVTALAMATLFRKTLIKAHRPPFIMELPPYRMPRWDAVVRVMWDRSKLFLIRAGTVILAMTVLLWAAMQYPTNPEMRARYEAERAELATQAPLDLDAQLAASKAAEAAEALEYSAAGRCGKAIEPLIKPLGYDWRIGVSIVASVAAREVFVSTLGIIYSVGEADEASTLLRDQIRGSTWPNGSRVFTPLVAVSVMVFYVLACQCMGTIAVVRRETNSWRWPLFMFGYMTALAYIGAFLVYQVGTLLGLGTA